MIRYVLNTLGSFRSALAVGLGLPFLMAASASAQAPAPEATTERVIVTGSYIPTAENRIGPAGYRLYRGSAAKGGV